MDPAQFLATDEATKSFLDESRCVVCKKLPVHPFRCKDDGSTREAHIFCDQCSIKLERQANQSRMCPGGGHVLTGLVRETFVEKHLSRLRLRCKWYQNVGYKGKVREICGRSPGCEWVGCLRDMREHLEKECRYERVKCGECGGWVRRGALELHMGLCGEGEVVCEFCKKKVMARELRGHHEVCTEKWIECPTKCLMETSGRLSLTPPPIKRMRRKELEKHLAVCPEGIVECSFVGIGCTARIRRRLKGKHETENLNQHLKLFLRFCEKRRRDEGELNGSPVPSKRRRLAQLTPNHVSTPVSGEKDHQGVGGDRRQVVDDLEYRSFVASVNKQLENLKSESDSLQAYIQDMRKRVTNFETKLRRVGSQAEEPLNALKRFDERVTELDSSVSSLKQAYKSLQKSVRQGPEVKPVIVPQKCIHQNDTVTIRHYRWSVKGLGDRTTATSTPFFQSGIAFVFSSTRKEDTKSTSFHVNIVHPDQGMANRDREPSQSCFKAKVLAKVTAETRAHKTLCTRYFRQPQWFHSQVGVRSMDENHEIRYAWGWSEFLNSATSYTPGEPIDFFVTLVTSLGHEASAIDNVEEVLGIEPRS